MMRLACVLALLGGCLIDHKPPPCLVAGEAPPDFELRDPATGQCQSFGSPCNSQCGPCAAGGAEPDWPVCFGACDSLTETQCLATPSCHAAYQDDPTPSPVFWGCWDMPPSGVVHGSCANLDALSCAEHDDCVSIYTGPVNQPQGFVPSFESCQAEVAQAACATLATEAACKARTDCDPVYDGMNCTCDKDGCMCQTETYSHCQ